MTLIASSQRSKGLQDMRWLRLSVIAGLLLPGAAMAADMPGLVPPPVAAPPAQILAGQSIEHAFRCRLRGHKVRREAQFAQHTGRLRAADDPHL